MMIVTPHIILDDPARDWAAAVIDNSGTSSDRTIYAANRLAVSAKNSDYWSKILRLNLMCGNQLAACLVPFKKDVGGTIEANTGFTAGQYTEATGLSYNGTDAVTQYLDVGITCSTDMTYDDTHIAFYSTADASDSIRFGNGCIGTGHTADFFVWTLFTTGLCYSYQYNDQAGQGVLSVTPPAGAMGFMLNNRYPSPSRLHGIYQAGSSLVADSNIGGSLPAFPFYLFTYYYQPYAGPQTLQGAVPFTNAAYSLGAGLSLSERIAYSNDMQEFQTELGREVS